MCQKKKGHYRSATILQAEKGNTNDIHIQFNEVLNTSTNIFPNRDRITKTMYVHNLGQLQHSINSHIIESIYSNSEGSNLDASNWVEVKIPAMVLSEEYRWYCW